MGAILPLIGYRSLSVLKNDRERAEYDDRSVQTIRRFVDIVSHREIRGAVRSSRGFLYNPDRVRPRNWLRSIEDERDADLRPVLKRLLEDDEHSFTLVVPSITHIMDGNIHDATALKLLMDGCIPVIDAGDALTNHGNFVGNTPQNGLTEWIKFIKREYMIDRAALTRSCLARFGAAELR